MHCCSAKRVMLDPQRQDSGLQTLQMLLLLLLFPLRCLYRSTLARLALRLMQACPHIWAGRLSLQLLQSCHSAPAVTCVAQG